MDAERARKEAEVEETGKSEEVGREGTLLSSLTERGFPWGF